MVEDVAEPQQTAEADEATASLKLQAPGTWCEQRYIMNITEITEPTAKSVLRLLMAKTLVC